MFLRTQTIESKDLWEEAEYTAVKPINCVAKYKIAMPSQINCVEGCFNCDVWKILRGVSHIENEVPAFSVKAGNTLVQCNTAIRVSIPNSVYYVEKWCVLNLSWDAFLKFTF